MREPRARHTSADVLSRPVSEHAIFIGRSAVKQKCSPTLEPTQPLFESYFSLSDAYFRKARTAGHSTPTTMGESLLGRSSSFIFARNIGIWLAILDGCLPYGLPISHFATLRR